MTKPDSEVLELSAQNDCRVAVANDCSPLQALKLWLKLSFLEYHVRYCEALQPGCG